MNRSGQLSSRYDLGYVVVRQDVADDSLAHVVFDRSNVISDTEAIGLSVLGGDVANVDLRRWSSYQAAAHALHKKVGKNACVKTPWPQNY